MTLYTSDMNKLKRSRQAQKMVITYLAISIFCIIFDKVYALFGHGVESAAMSLMFLYPLVGGVLPFGLLWLFLLQPNRITGYRLCYNCYNSGIAVLTIGSLLKGIFEIAGTSSVYLTVYTVCGWAMATIGFTVYLVNILRCKNTDMQTQ